MKIRVGDIRMVVHELLSEAQRDADYLKKINMHKIRDSEPDLDPRELQKRSLDGPIFDRDTIDIVADIPDHQFPRENRKQFVKWLVRMDFNEFADIGYVSDWINGANIQISDLPESWDDAYDFAVAWHESLSNEKLGSAIEVTGQENVVYEFSDGFKIIELTPEECASEGDSMQHCVGGEGYTQDVREGNMKLFSLRDPENRPHATVSVVPGILDRWKVDQVKGKQNEVPIEKYARRVKEWLKTTEFDVVDSTDYLSILSVDEKRDLLIKSKGAPGVFQQLVEKIISNSDLSIQDLTKISLGAAMSVVDKVSNPKRTRELLDIVRDWTKGMASDEDVERAGKELWKLYVTIPGPGRLSRSDVSYAYFCHSIIPSMNNASIIPFNIRTCRNKASWAITNILSTPAEVQFQDVINSIEKEIGMPLEDFLFKNSIEEH